MRAVVEQEDGEDAVGNDGAHQLRGAIEQRLQVERGVKRIGEPDKESEVSRLNPRVERIEVSMRVIRVRGAIVAFKLVRSVWGA